VYDDYAPLSKQYDYFAECLWGIDGLRFAGSFINVFTELKKKQAGAENKFDEILKKSTPALPLKNLNKATDKKLCAAMLSIYLKDIDRKLMPRYLDSLYSAHNNDANAVTEFLYNTSNFIDSDKAKIMFSNFEANASVYEQDPLYRLSAEVYKHYQKTVIPQISYYEKQINDLQKEYMQGLRENVKNKKFYP